MGALFSFEGRASRAQYWAYVAFNILANVVAGMVDFILGTGGFVQGLAWLLLLIPGVAIGVRRFHDRDKSGWWVLLGLVPVIGWIWLVVELGFLPGTPGANRFGPEPGEAWDPRIVWHGRA